MKFSLLISLLVSVPILASEPATDQEKIEYYLKSIERENNSIRSEPIREKLLSNPSPIGQINRRWHLSHKRTLRENLYTWAKAAGYGYAWSDDQDMTIASSANYYGDFITVINALFAHLYANNVPYRAVIYKSSEHGSKVLKIDRFINE